MTRWYEDHGELASFARVLADNGMGAMDLAYYVEKPWKWTSEYDEWVKRGRPDEFDFEAIEEAAE